MARTDYLQLAKEAFDASSSFIDTNYRADWEYGLKTFRLEHASGSRYLSEDYKARSRIVSPKTRSIIRKNEAAGMQAAFSNREMVSVSPANPDDVMSVASAACMKEIMEYRLSRTLPAFELYIGGLQDAQTTGAVCSYQYWEYQERPDGRKVKDQPCIELRPIENIRLDGGASWLDPVNTSPYFCDILPMYVCDVRAMMTNKDDKTGSPKWKKFDDKVIARARPDVMDTTRKARLGSQQDPQQETTGIKAFDIVWVMRWFMRDSQGEDHTFYTLGTEELLSEVKPLEEVYFHGKRPYVMGCAILETHKVMKSSMPVLIRPLQTESTAVRNQRLDNVLFVLNKRWLVARGRNADTGSLIRNVPGGITMTTDPKNDIVESNWPDVTSSSYVEHDRLNSEMDDLAGNFSPSTRVANNAVNDTLGGSKMASQGAGLMSEYLLRTVNETWWEKVLRQLALLEQYYETDDIVLTLCANKAKLFPRFGISKITDHMLMNEVVVGVDMAMGDPSQRFQKFLMATNAAIQVTLQTPPGANAAEMRKEIYANAGYRDGERFWSEQQDPRLLKAMEMVQQLQGLLKGKQMELQAGAQVEQAKLASNERIKGAEIQVDAQRIAGDLRIRESELVIEGQKIELERLKLQLEAGVADQDAGLRVAEMQSKIAESEKKIEHERMKIAAQIQSDRENAIREVEKLVAVHTIKVQGMLEVDAAKRKAEAKDNDVKAQQADSAVEASRREGAEKMSKELASTLKAAIETLGKKKSIEIVKKDGEIVGANVS